METRSSNFREQPGSGRCESAPEGVRLWSWGRRLLAGNLALGLWVTGSAAHLYCVGYVSDLAFHPWMLTPLTLVLAWTAWHRLPALRPQPVAVRSLLRQALLVFTALTPLLAATAPTSSLFFALTILNTALFGWVRCIDPRNKLAGQLALASGVALLTGLPTGWGVWLAP